MTQQVELVEAGSPDALALEAARRFVELGQEALATHASFCVALSGGSTPRAMYAQLAAPTLRDSLDWARVHLFFSDERFVPPDSPDSNYHTAREGLISHISVPPDHVHPYATVDLSPEDAARQYEDEVRRIVQPAAGAAPAFDLVLLGMGPDGHTASLFPGTEALTIEDRLVAPNYVPRMNAWRLTFTFPLLNAARTVMFLVQGDDKKERVREVMHGGSDLPASRVHPTDGHLVWLLDHAAAAEIDGNGPGAGMPALKKAP